MTRPSQKRTKKKETFRKTSAPQIPQNGKRDRARTKVDPSVAALVDELLAGLGLRSAVKRAGGRAGGRADVGRVCGMERVGSGAVCRGAGWGVAQHGREDRRRTGRNREESRRRKGNVAEEGSCSWAEGERRASGREWRVAEESSIDDPGVNVAWA